MRWYRCLGVGLAGIEQCAVALPGVEVNGVAPEMSGLASRAGTGARWSWGTGRAGIAGFFERNGNYCIK